MSHLTKHSGAQSSTQVDQFPHMPSPPPTQFVSNLYSLLLDKLDHLALAQSRFQETQFVDASHFAAAYRLSEMHYSRIQQHLGYDTSKYTEFLHPIPPIGPPFTA